jgi:hypothetical protein
MRKNLDISEEAVEALTIQAIKEKTVFKLKAEQILEDAAKPFIVLKKQKRVGKKSFKKKDD